MHPFLRVTAPHKHNSRNKDDIPTTNLLRTQFIDIVLIEAQVESLLCVPVPEYICPTSQIHTHTHTHK